MKHDSAEGGAEESPVVDHRARRRAPLRPYNLAKLVNSLYFALVPVLKQVLPALLNGRIQAFKVYLYQVAYGGGSPHLDAVRCENEITT